MFLSYLQSTQFSFKNYYFWAMVRIALTLIPQTGYIHPDEYFQNTEILAGDILGLDSEIPWEFEENMPLRSIICPALTSGLAYVILKVLNKFGGIAITTYTLVVVPRIIMCTYSFLIDYCMFKLISRTEKRKLPVTKTMIILSTSFIILIYGSRTFSNTIELILFSLLLHYVSDSIFKLKLNSQQQKRKIYHLKMITFNKSIIMLTKSLPKHVFEIALVTVIGVFNRPTFLAYSLMPLLFWLLQDLKHNNPITVSLTFHWRILALILISIPMIVTFALIDSFYFRSLTLNLHSISMKNITVTPINFINYNSNPDNLAKHGLHNRLIHLLVNIPLLFNIAGVIILVQLAGFIIKLMTFSPTLIQMTKTSRIYLLMSSSFWVPLTVLSLVRHQEHRFLIPLLFPVVFLTGKYLVKLEGHNRFLINEIGFKLWLIINLSLVIFFGFFHQSGIYRFSSFISNQIQDHSRNYHIFSSHSYDIPFSFLNHKNISENLFIHNTHSNNIDVVFSDVTKIQQNLQKIPKFYTIFILIPDILVQNKHNISAMKYVNNFQFHYSTEALVTYVNNTNYMNLFHLKNVFNLKLFQIN